MPPRTPVRQASTAPSPIHTEASETGRDLRAWTRLLLKKSFSPLFCVYVYLLVVLPSGTIFGVNLKIICFFLLFPPALFSLVENRKTTLLHLCLLLGIPATLSLWILIAQFYGVDVALSLSEYKDIMITLVSSWLAAVYFTRRSLLRIEFLRTVLYAEIVACLLKVLLLGYSASKGIPVSIVVNSINSFFGVNLMGMDFESALGRIQFIADGLIPLCLFLLMRYRRVIGVGAISFFVMYVLLSLSLAFAFSRYLWAFAAVAFFLGMLGKKDRLHFILMALLGLAIVALYPLISEFAELRFSADVAGSSDQARTEQVTALHRFFLDAPLLGHGFGSYTPDVIRSEELPYVYEDQLFALAGQEGIVGLLLMSVVVSSYFGELWPFDASWKVHGLNKKVSLFFLLLAWLAAGFYNPMLLNSAAAMSYAMIKALAGLDEDGESFTRESNPVAVRAAAVGVP